MITGVTTAGLCQTNIVNELLSNSIYSFQGLHGLAGKVICFESLHSALYYLE